MQRLENRIYISTRPEEQNRELKNLLEEEGATVFSMPTIDIKEEEWSAEKEQYLLNISNFQWLIFTSANGVRYFFEKYQSIHKHQKLPSTLRIAVVGKKTASIVSEYGHEVDYVNRGNTGEELAKELFEIIRPNERILLALGDLARKSLEDGLKEKGDCTRIEVYKTVMPTIINEEAISKIVNNQYDSIIIASPSAFHNLMTILNDKVDRSSLRLTSIGSTTTSEVIAAGLKPQQTAAMASTRGLFEAIVQQSIGENQ